MTSAFIRKRSINPKSASSTGSSSQIPSSQSAENITLHSSSKNTSSLLAVIQNIVTLRDQLSNLPLESWEKSIAELMRDVADHLRKSTLLDQLQAHRECLNLMTKYQVQLNKRGLELNQQQFSLSLSLFRFLLEDLSKLTQNPNYDQQMIQANLVKSIVNHMEVFAGIAQKIAGSQEKKPILIRKNSLKKIEQLPALRPSSRGKLSSLTKKDSSQLLTKKDIEPKIEGSMEKEESALVEKIVCNLCSILKNFSANEKLRKEMLTDETLRMINRYLCIWSDKNAGQFGNAVMMQLTACYRHLAVEDKSYKRFMESNCMDTWARLIELFPTNSEVIFNILRVLSKLSNYESCCLKLNQKKLCLKTLCSFFKVYKHHIHIIIRVAFIFANMTSYLADIRHELYFDFQAWKDIFICFEHYATIQLSGKNQTDKMGLSMAAWDYQAIKKESDIEAVIKIIRLIANLFTVTTIGQHIYVNEAASYKEMIKKLKNLLERKQNLQKSLQLVTCSLSCLTNILYYDKQILMSTVQYRTVKQQLVTILVDFVVQIDDEEICCESLRVISNLTRIREYCKAVIEAKIHEAVIILLESTSKEIVYYSLGILSNLMGDDDFKQQYKDQIITCIVSILSDCNQEDFDVVTIALKTLAVIIENRNQNIDPKQLATIENSLLNLGNHCDQVMLHSTEKKSEMSEVQQSRSLINMLLNSMPEEKFVCSIKNCGRKFPDEMKLQDHMKRRHKLS